MQIESYKDRILSSYTSDRRAFDIPNFRREDLGNLVRYTPTLADAGGIVCFAEISEFDLDREIAAQCEYFKTKNLGFEWKVYDGDEPSDLTQRLIAHGFKQG